MILEILYVISIIAVTIFMYGWALLVSQMNILVSLLIATGVVVAFIVAISLTYTNNILS